MMSRAKPGPVVTSKGWPGIRLTVAAALVSAAGLSASDFDSLGWEQLRPIPDSLGVAGAFAGTSDDVLIVGGGANFPDGMPWEGGVKKWHDEIFVLAEPKTRWQSGFKLPKPNAYGVSVTTAKGVVCAGGGNASEHFRDVFLLTWAGNAIRTQTLPPLPRPNAFGAGALLDGIVYIAGGLLTPASSEPLRVFWALDVKKRNPAWKELEPWPGPARMLAVTAVHDGSFFLVSGTDLKREGSSRSRRVYLSDAYRYSPGKGWKRLADLPHPAVAAPSPAPVVKEQLLVISGDDGSFVDFEPKSKHPGFRRDILVYDIRKDIWRQGGDSLLSCATAPTVQWNKRFLIISGEVKPGQRSPEVWALSNK